MQTKLDYVSGQTILPEGAFGISPSQLELFFSKPHEWFRTQVLGEASEFTGSTSSYLGTVIHYIAEQFTLTRSVDKSEIYKYLYRDLCLNTPPFDNFSDEQASIAYLREYANHPTIDCNHILDQFKIMGNELIQYLRRNLPQKAEELVSAQVRPNYFVCGSVDAYNNGCVIDYKTTSDTTPKDYIPYNYKLQLLCYAYIYRSMGYHIDRIRIVWITQPQLNRVSEKTGKPLKDYPCQVVPVTYQLTRDDWTFIESILNLISETVQAYRDHPSLAHVIWKDYRLKPTIKETNVS